MKRILAAVLCLIMTFSIAGCVDTESTEGADTENLSSSGTEMKMAENWVSEHIKNDTIFSFDYDGVVFADFIKDWEKTVEKGEDEEGNKTYTLTYYNKEDKVTAWADFTLYKESPAVEWVAYFKNEADIDSPVISNIQALDSYFEGKDVTLTYANGSNANEFDFTPVAANLKETPSVSFSAFGGRSSCGYMPYFDLAAADGSGIVAAIGWTGQWACSIEAEEDRVNMIAGMEKTSISLYTDENMRTPSIVLTFFEDGAEAGHNVFRQMILNYYTPVDENGETVTKLPMLVNNWGSAGAEALMGVIDLYDMTGMDYDGLWVDAGWYGDRASADTYDMAWSQEVGSWYVNTDIYPDGFGKISEELTSQGKEFLLWFEPERAIKGTALLTEHPEYYLEQSPTSMFYLYNFASDEATDYLIDYIDNMIKENGITWYRQDFNCDPLSKWTYVDSKSENRTGMTEIMYITNLYRYLDTLVERNPGLMIDNCASGGRRLDIEMTKRSFPLWRTDYPVSSAGNKSNADGVRNIGMNLTYWLPLSGGASGVDGYGDAYGFRSMLSSGLTVGTVTSSYSWYSTMFEQYRTCQSMMLGDYYILTQGAGEKYKTENAAYMYYLPQDGTGYIVAFRPKASATEQQEYKLKGLDADETYVLKVADTGETITADGISLMENGLGITMESARSAQLIFITKQ